MKGPGKALGKAAWSLEPRLAVVASVAPTVRSRSSAAVLSPAAPMRSVREQPWPKRLAMRPRTESHKRMIPSKLKMRKLTKNYFQKNAEKSRRNVPVPVSGTHGLARLRRRSANEHHALPSNLITLCRFKYLISRYQDSRLGHISANRLPHFVFIKLLLTSRCLTLKLRRASE